MAVARQLFRDEPLILSRNGGAPEQFQGESSEIVIAEAIRFIGNSTQSEQPFFAVVWFGSPHEPYSGLENDLALYDDFPDSYRDRQVSLTSMKTGRPVRRPFDEVLRERFAEITAMDRAIGQLRQYLDNEGLRQNTLLWYCGDNGVPNSGRLATPFRGQKGLVYEAVCECRASSNGRSGFPSPDNLTYSVFFCGFWEFLPGPMRLVDVRSF
jgi:arylsulfatase A-like enzyme